jgi:hypothetical protein
MVAAMRVTRPSSAREAMDVTVLLAVRRNCCGWEFRCRYAGCRGALGTAFSMSAGLREVNSFERCFW